MDDELAKAVGNSARELGRLYAELKKHCERALQAESANHCGRLDLLEARAHRLTGRLDNHCGRLDRIEARVAQLEADVTIDSTVERVERLEANNLDQEQIDVRMANIVERLVKLEKAIVNLEAAK